jgi:hypothetical protein
MANARLTARRAAAVLEPTLKDFRGDLTVADGAARGGLALRDAEIGLRWLAAERGGQLKATETGELLYSFPNGPAAPAQPKAFGRVLRACGRALASVGRFIVRAWVSVVMVTYALVFVGVAIAMASSRDGEGAGDALAGVLEVIVEALYWTFHPLSPVNWGREPVWARRGRRRQRGLPFYERVNRFVFGPPPVVEDPRERERRVLEEIRRCEGRVGPGDVMRASGVDREAAERDLLRLVVDYEGDIQVSDDGAIIYVFRALRTTAGEGGAPPTPRYAWSERRVVPPLTGNSTSTNAALVALNAFNLTVSGIAVAAGLTVERIFEVMEHARLVASLGPDAPPLLASHGVPLLLGWVPLVFSTGLFLLPARRALRRRSEKRAIAAENGRRALMRLTLAEPGLAELSPALARRVWVEASGTRDSEAVTTEIEAAVRALGGEIDLDGAGAVVYVFATEARERRALRALRAAAPSVEAVAGPVVFSSAEETTGAIDEDQEVLSLIEAVRDRVKH